MKRQTQRTSAEKHFHFEKTIVSSLGDGSGYRMVFLPEFSHLAIVFHLVVEQLLQRVMLPLQSRETVYKLRVRQAGSPASCLPELLLLRGTGILARPLYRPPGIITSKSAITDRRLGYRG